MKRLGAIRNQQRLWVMPPSLQSQVTVSKTLRFKSSTSVDNSISAHALINAAGMSVTVVNTSLTSIFQSVRLHYVEVWLVAGSGIGDVSVRWLMDSDDTMGGPGLLKSDVTMGTAYPAHVKTKPPTGSSASFWQHLLHAGTTQELFHIKTSGACIVDVSATWVMRDGNDAIGTSDTNYAVSAAPNLGEIYAPALEGTTDVLIPVGRQTTT